MVGAILVIALFCIFKNLIKTKGKCTYCDNRNDCPFKKNKQD